MFVSQYFIQITPIYFILQESMLSTSANKNQQTDNKETDLSTIIELIGMIQTQTSKKYLKNRQLQHQVQQLQQSITNVQQQIKTRIQKIKICLQSIWQSCEQKQSNIISLINNLQEGIKKSQQQMNCKLQPPIQILNFEYHINQPRYFMTLDDRIQGCEENMGKEKQRREDQMRSLKIRISLGEIQLKELRNRTKKG